jgi:hypothetical protein
MENPVEKIKNFLIVPHFDESEEDPAENKSSLLNTMKSLELSKNSFSLLKTSSPR